MPETYFCAFISSCGKCLKIKTEWEKDEFKLIILQDCDSWECKVTAADITKELPGINANSYIELSKEILARKNKGKLCDYSVDENIFSWQKRSEDGEVIFSGFANLKKIPYNESIIKFVDSFLSLNSELTDEVTVLEQDRKTLEAGVNYKPLFALGDGLYFYQFCPNADSDLSDPAIKEGRDAEPDIMRTTGN